MKKTTTTDTGIEILRKAMLFRLTRHAWQNRAQADNEDITAEANKDQLTVTKRLVECDELKAIYQYNNEVYSWCLNHSMMNTVAKGTYFVRRDMVGEFEKYLEQANRKLQNELVPAFISVYPIAKQKAKLTLNGMYREEDYPTADELADSFSFDHSWLALSVPNELPEEIRKRECDKLRHSFQDAQEEVRVALREGFKRLVDNAAKLLTEKSDSGRNRIFGKKTVESLDKFFDTFRARNLLDDAELEALVAQAKETVSGISLKQLKKSDTARESTAQRFEEVSRSMAKLLEEMPSRKFRFSE